MADHHDGLATHPYLQFPENSVGQERVGRLLGRTVVGTAAADFEWLAKVDVLQPFIEIVGANTPWWRLFESAMLSSYMLLTVEFLSTFTYEEREGATPQLPNDAPNEPEPQRISFRMLGNAYGMTLSRFAIVSGLYTPEETHTPAYTDAIRASNEAAQHRWWDSISTVEWDPNLSRGTSIRFPLIRYIHRLIASSITARRDSRERCTGADLYYLHAFVNRTPCPLAHGLADYLSRQGSRAEGAQVTCGAFITKIAQSLGVISDNPQHLGEPVLAKGMGLKVMNGMRLLRKITQGRNSHTYRLIDPIPEPVREEPVPEEGHDDDDGGAGDDDGGAGDQGNIAHEVEHVRYRYRAVRMPPVLSRRIEEMSLEIRRLGRQHRRHDRMLNWQIQMMSSIANSLHIHDPPPYQDDDEDDEDDD
ncbi:hypothetical protein SSX86_006224 [Deinandra increscens subsp. villosa]|uniref:Uncharacterized protein n=1 Tax=Deinandra increscens subsp. villosa TaxID=3103831 RepID=A0AAP0DNA2_9ASTR